MSESSYPRVGFPIVPRAFREAFAKAGPTELAGLDADSWHRLGEERCRELAWKFHLMLRANPQLGTIIADEPVSMSRESVSLDDLELRKRTFRLLSQAGIRSLAGGTDAFTVRELLRLRGFGVGSLVDLLTSLEAVETHRGHGRRPPVASRTNNAGIRRVGPEKARPAGGGAASPRFRKAAAQLASIPGALEATRADPRLGPLLADFHCDARTLGEMLLANSPEGSRPASGTQLSRLRRQIKAMCRLTAETEILEILSVGRRPVDRRMIAACLKWRAARRPSLRGVGRQFGVTGERVRQVFYHWRAHRRREAPFAPVLDRALEIIRRATPGYAAPLAQRLVRQGLISKSTPLEALSEWARLLGREPNFALLGRGDTQSAVPESDVARLRATMWLARCAVRRPGVATVAALRQAPVAKELAESVLLQGLRSIDGFYWVDESRGVFSIRGRTGLESRIRKVLCVAPRISVETLLEILQRDSRFRSPEWTPQNVLAYCRLQPDWRVAGTTLVAKQRETPADVLQGDELAIVTFVGEHGPLCDRTKICQFADEKGIGRDSLDRCLSCPSITRYAPGVYGLTGGAHPAHAAATK